VRRFFIWLLWAVLSTALFSSPNTLKKIGIKNHELRLTFSSWISSDAIHQMTLSNPPRQVIDIKNAHLKNRKNISRLKASGVKKFRIAQRGKNLRIVIETEEGYKCRGYQPMASRTSYRIPLPKKGRSGSAPKAKKHARSDVKPAKKSSSSKKAPARRAKKREKVTKKRAAPKPQVVEEEKASIFSSIFSAGTSGPRRSYTIVIDAGHGGHDSGAIGGGRYEKDLVLQIARRTAKYLKKKRFKVKMTRSTDRFVKLKKRTHYANRQKADIFVSIHANAIANKKRFGKVYGVETYFLQTTRSAKAKRIAAIENSVVLDKNDYLSNDVILQAVLSGPKIELSHKLAIDVQSKILRHARQKYRGIKDGGVKPAPFWVLVGAQMPSILVEVGYITNPIERRRLFNADYQNRIAKGIVDGISNYLILREKEMY
jgi:N-acetylmuramoyl-L-alanine amidase